MSVCLSDSLPQLNDAVFERYGYFYFILPNYFILGLCWFLAVFLGLLCSLHRTVRVSSKGAIRPSVRPSVCLSVSWLQLDDAVFDGYGYCRTPMWNTMLEVERTCQRHRTGKKALPVQPEKLSPDGCIIDMPVELSSSRDIAFSCAIPCPLNE